MRQLIAANLRRSAVTNPHIRKKMRNWRYLCPS